MKRHILMFLALCLMLTGCGWLEGNYASVTPHASQGSSTASQTVEAANETQLRQALENMISSGTESQVITVADFDPDRLDSAVASSARYAAVSYPIGAYAVEEITYEVGTSGGVPAVAVQITYLHTRTEIQNIQSVANMEAAADCIGESLTQFDTSLVMLIENYSDADIQQIVSDYASAHPSSVMETPEVVTQTYPASGKNRVLEVKFTYQTSRDSLRVMQTQVARIFNSAALYISEDATDAQQFAQLYAFLMERFPEFQIKTSITPAYSLLNHGVGDSKAFATVYAEMCTRSGLDCQVVVGTWDGQPHFWNMVLDDGYYYHVDLLACWNAGSYRELTDGEMTSYVWDYSAYPECPGAPEETAAPEETPTLPTETESPETQPTEIDTP